MNVSLKAHNLSKRYNLNWIFKNFSYHFHSYNKYAIVGNNGSGKSTLTQILAGYLTHTTGSISTTINETAVDEENLFAHSSFTAPYLELIEEYTALELIKFHTKFKPLTESATGLLEAVHLTDAANKKISAFSSGMKQRLKLGLAFLSTAPILLLDEPTTNFDEPGIALYHSLLHNFTENKLVIISSNIEDEYKTCNEIININNYKK